MPTDPSPIKKTSLAVSSKAWARFKSIAAANDLSLQVALEQAILLWIKSEGWAVKGKKYRLRVGGVD